MRRFFLNRYGQPVLRFRLIHMLAVMVWVAVVFSLYEAPWVAAGAGAAMVIAYLHYLSLGRTTPLAAFVFVLCCFLTGLAVGIPFLIDELKGRSNIARLTTVDYHYFFAAVVCFSLFVSALVAVVTAIEKRGEWFNHRG